MNMTIFDSLVGMCLVAIALWFMFFFLYRFNEYFKETYGLRHGLRSLQYCRQYAWYLQSFLMMDKVKGLFG